MNNVDKAEQRAFEAYPVHFYDDVAVDTNSLPREYYVEGYHQAEKDNELTWKDMLRIDEITSQVFKDSDTCQTEVIYQEVLKRFNEQRKKK